MRLLRSRKWRTAGLVIGVAVLTIGGLWYRNPEVPAAYSRHIAMTIQFRNGPDGLRRDFATGRFRAGTPVEDLVAAHPPRRIVRAGRYSLIDYNRSLSFEGTTILARDDRLAFAGVWSCTFRHVFFDDFNPQESATVDQQITAMERRERHTAMLTRMAVASILISRNSAGGPLVSGEDED